MIRYVEQIVTIAHGLSGAAWFGAIFYRTLVIDPKAFWFFENRAEYERFSTYLAHGMRYMVTAGMLTCGLSGFLLMAMKWQPTNTAWLGLMLAKSIVWLLAGAVFVYVSWVHWPYRSLAAPAEFAHYRREGVILAIAMVLLSGTGFVLGQTWRLCQ